ncbi:MAG: polysaccharide biosynthesis protein, partial [Fusobacteriaceae bacterium]
MVEEKLLDELLSNKRNFVKLGIDIFSLIFGVILALMTRFGNSWPMNAKKEYILIYGSFFLIFYFFKRDGIKSWSFTNSLDILHIIFTHLLALVTTILYMSIFRMNYSRGIVILTMIFAIIIQLGGRFIFRLNRTYSLPQKGEKKKKKTVVVYGAGEMGVNLVRETKINSDFKYDVVGFIDDDSKKRGNYVNNVKVLGDISELEEILEKKAIEILIIAISDLEKDKIVDLVARCKEFHVSVKILPQVGEILSNDSLFNQIRDVSIEDLLGREQVLVNGANIKDIIQNKVVFVTGGAGSIGSELARQIAKYSPKKLILIDLNENDLYFLELELKRSFKNLDIQPEIANIREADKVELLFKKYLPNIIFHAAAHKHVPLMEHNPEEAVKNNIFGTKKVAEMAIKYSAERFVLISTDKAVNPTNVMGATKRACELVV